MDGRFKNKDKSIKYIYNYITNNLVDITLVPIIFWDDDLFAIGLKCNNKLIYLSTWDFRLCDEENMRYYAEFEKINALSFETVKVFKKINEITKEDLLNEIKYFIARS